jgi:hypothetical protein
LATAALALAILAVAVFAHQINLRQAEVLAEYEKGGAASFVVEFPASQMAISTRS